MSSEDRGVDITTCLPPCEAVRDLLSIGVCLRCILRLFGICGQSSLLSSPSLFSTLESTLEHHTDPNSPFCCICLGILQFCYTQQDTHEDPLTTFTASIADTIKPHHHEFASFALDISIPSVVRANERAICSYMDVRYKSQHKLQHISVEEALQFSITTSLETLLDAKFGFDNSFHITLTYTHSKPSIPIPDQDSKRMKIDPFTPPLEKVAQPCSLTSGCYRQPVYIVGRYLKLSRNVSQTRWIIDDERKGEASVEEIIGNAILPFCRADDYKFHAAGREDIDVRMLGCGRPFLIQLQNPRSDPSKLSIQQIENQINNSEAKLVRVKNSKVVGIEGWNLMRQGEEEKQKQYAALVWVSSPLKDEHLQTIASLENMKISQRTPIRVLHRRSPLDRERIIHSMKIERIDGSTHYFLLHLCTQAGTYIKEFVHGDLGRTHPSVGSILGCRAEILQLDVTDVKMNCFI